MDAMSAMMGGPAMALGGAPAAPGGFAPFTAFNKHGLLVTFSCSKDAASPSVTAIEAIFTNSLPVPIGALNFQVAVPKYMKLQMSPASGNVVPPNNSGKVTQLFKVANSMHGQKPVLVRTKIDFNASGQAFSETGQVDSFPAGL
jgi:AP-1 complex subunit gamma-1